VDDPDNFVISASNKSLITSILSAGTFFGALIAGDLADWFGRRTTIISGCGIFMVGVALQTASTTVALLVVGRLIAGFGVGFVSAILILYMSEISPRKVRGAIVSGYQFCVTVGLMLASCVDYGTENRTDSGSYRIPIALQLLWAIILATGLFFLPESPRYYVRKGDVANAAKVLARVRGQPLESSYVKEELAEIVANNEYEMQMIPQGGYFATWFNCFRGSIWSPNSNLRRTILGTSLQMMQQYVLYAPLLLGFLFTNSLVGGLVSTSSFTSVPPSSPPYVYLALTFLLGLSVNRSNSSKPSKTPS
jgi:MFS family permease